MIKSKKSSLVDFDLFERGKMFMFFFMFLDIGYKTCSYVFYSHIDVFYNYDLYKIQFSRQKMFTASMHIFRLFAVKAGL